MVNINYSYHKQLQFLKLRGLEGLLEQHLCMFIHYLKSDQVHPEHTLLSQIEVIQTLKDAAKNVYSWLKVGL